MNKKIIIAIVVLLLLAAGAYGYYRYHKHQQAAMMATAPTQPTKAPSVFSSIQDALMKNLSLQCNYTDDQNNTTVAYIKAGAIRADITNSSTKTTNSVIVKDQKVYFWDQSKKTGMMMAMPANMMTPEAMPSGTTQTQPGNNTNSGQNMMAALEKFKQYCKPATVETSLFTVPTDVTFTDISQMQQQMMKVTGMPHSVPPQYQQYMQGSGQTPTGY